jgi:ribosomal protein L21
MNSTQRLLGTVTVAVGLLSFAGVATAAGKANHHDGQAMLGERIKTNGHHVIHKKGDHSISVEVKDGKVAGVHVKHAKKGDVAVTKYKTHKKLAQADGRRSSPFVQVQYQDLGVTYIGYAYIDELGYEEIYWFPFEMIYDGATGAIDYVALT